ncbi:ABC transporter ATP-binding protein [Corynebacterium sphenisci]|uniref:ABC transporter ATP-binding protein n=1 Tax=Corynebacterium sphenisci TaxID=191493 RepID=UPI0026E09F80|nr:ABC transporter ATP-binding protein [Corynebacterium sphenisci]MDO5730555.1 ABC transporter ATP-binding protein [Corynebacterium sphenisci]
MTAASAPARQAAPTAGRTGSGTPRIAVRDLTVGYGEATIIEGMNLELPADCVTTLIGPNGCGKSTLLNSIATVLDHEGVIELDGEDIERIPRKARATRLSLLPQQPIAPEGISVAQLVSRGRHPHQSWLSRWSAEDAAKVAEALELTGMTHLRARPLSSLSGGQRQHVWLAMALAQETPTMLLDEPTTYLDLANSLEILRLVRRLTPERTVVMVLHDLNLAARFSDHLVVMKDGSLITQGEPGEVITRELLHEVFGFEALVVDDPAVGGPHIVPE